MERGAYRYWPAMGRSGIRGGRRYQLAGPGVTVPRIALVSLSNLLGIAAYFPSWEVSARNPGWFRENVERG
jgi:hypothetical protein